MRLDVPLSLVTRYPTETIAALLPPTGSSIWDFDNSRQKRFKAHSQTRSILFCWLENNWRPGEPLKIRTYDYAPAELTRAVSRCAELLEQHFEGKVVKLMLAELAAGGQISRHVDGGAALTQPHRCHIPLVTHPACEFMIDDVSNFLESGAVYEFDNTRPHAVANNGPAPRIHLICDIMPMGVIGGAEVSYDSVENA